MTVTGYCCNVCQALENSLVLVPELAHLRMSILRYTNVFIIIIIIIIIIADRASSSATSVEQA